MERDKVLEQNEVNNAAGNEVNCVDDSEVNNAIDNEVNNAATIESSDDIGNEVNNAAVIEGDTSTITTELHRNIEVAPVHTQAVEPALPNIGSNCSSQESKPLGFFSRVVGTIFYPGRVMEDLAERPRVLFGLLLSLLMLPGYYLLRFSMYQQMLKQTLELQYLNMGMSIAGEAFDLTVTMAAYGGLVSGGVAAMVLTILVALGLFILMKIFRGEGKFKAYLSVVGYSGVISLLNVLTLYGVSFITGELATDLSLAAFLPAGSSPVLSAALTNFSLFNIWSYVVIGIGAAAVAKFGKGKAFAVTTILFAFVVAIGCAIVLLTSNIVAVANING